MVDALDPKLLQQAFDRMLTGCRRILEPGDRIVGIQRGGVILARHIGRRLSHPDKIGEVDVNFHRDDFGRQKIQKSIAPSVNLLHLNDARILLVDDVLWTGRTVRAALNELFDFGRPRRVFLAVLFDRSGRELPIQADVRGKKIDLDADRHIKVALKNDRLVAGYTRFNRATDDHPLPQP